MMEILKKIKTPHLTCDTSGDRSHAYNAAPVRDKKPIKGQE